MRPYWHCNAPIANSMGRLKAPTFSRRGKLAEDVYDRTGVCKRKARSVFNAMTLNTDLVIVGMTAAAVAAATYAARRGQRVFVVDESRDASYLRDFRRALDAAGHDCRGRISVAAGFQVLSVDGISAIEVVLIRHAKTGRLLGINTSAALMTTSLASGIIGPMIRDQVQQSLSD